MSFTQRCLMALPLAALAACATVPDGPSVRAFPGPHKSFEDFQADDAVCRNYAASQNRSPSDAQADSVVKSAALGTVIGAVAGAAIGGSRGAGVGAGTGLLFGTAAGASAGNQAAYGTQRRYDDSYVACMYAKGEKVPVYGRMVSQQPAPQYAPPPPPPPPPDYPQYPAPPSAH